jgi:hypothetical protein
MSQERREETSVLHALGLLADDELTRFRQECRADPGLREMSRVLREVTAQLVHWAPPHSPPEALRERLVEGIGSRRGHPGGPGRAAPDGEPAD